MSAGPVGGYRQPSNPAPVSGPGAMSQRTDGGATEGMTQPQQQYTGFDYSENKAVNDQQGQAPLIGSRKPTSIPLSAPTQYPDEPMSYGADYGDGPGLDTSMINVPQPVTIQNTLYKAKQNDTTGYFELLYNRMNQA